MTTPARRRLINDYRKFQKEAIGLDCLVRPMPDNIMLWEAIIIGPDDTEWEGGVFKLIIEFGEKFPNEPPKVRFLTSMFHPNIYKNGSICLDILDKNWTVLYDCLAILTSIQSLLSDPNPDSPANTAAAMLFTKEDKTEYYEKVRECVINSWIS